MPILNSVLFVSPLRFYGLNSNPIIRPLLCCFFSSSSVPLSLSYTSTPPISSTLLFNYVIKTFSFSEKQALSVSNRFSWIKTLDKPQSVVQFLQQLGFSNTHIRSAVRASPQILFSDIDRTLKPKLEFFQELGLDGPDLGEFISKNTPLLTCSLDKKLIPCVSSIKKILVNDQNNQDLFRVLRRCNWVAPKDPNQRLLCNVAFFRSCNIVGSQLAMLLKRQPRLFVMKESALQDLVSQVLKLGFSVDSRMFVHAFHTVSSMSAESFSRKLELFRSFGFSEGECLEMFRRAPALLRTSREKLKFGIGFFLNDIGFERSVLVHRPTCLMHSMEERVVPRYRVLQVMKFKKLLKKEPSFVNVLCLSEEEFLDKFISRFRDEAEELLMAYKGHVLDSSEKLEV